MTKARLEKKYGVSIEWDHWNEEYVIYSADGCKWENGLHSIKACEKECKEWEAELLAIKQHVAEYRASLR